MLYVLALVVGLAGGYFIREYQAQLEKQAAALAASIEAAAKKLEEEATAKVTPKAK